MADAEVPDLYLELLKKSLTNTLRPDPELVAVRPHDALRKSIVKALGAAGFVLTRSRENSVERRAKGLDGDPRADTMIGIPRLDNIQHCVETVIRDGVPGDLIEAGVWRGGAAVFMRAILKARGVEDRIVWLADSFQGLPKPDAGRYPDDEGDIHHQYTWLAVTLDVVKDTFRRYGLLDEQVRFLEGWFKDTLPNAPIKRLAVARLDGDMYESTMDALTALYPRLSVGGFVILDDWQLIPNCRKAIEDFRAAQGITEPIQAVDGNAGYWRRVR